MQDYQLVPGDTVNLRLPDRATGRPVTVPFRYAGVVSEFPTAPRDSFFVANADYVAARTGSDAVGTFLVDTGGRDTTRVATDLRALLGTSATVTDVADTRSRVGSSLTSVDLAALTRVELGFALVLAAAAGGLVSFLGLTERRRSFAIIGLLGATSRQSRALVRAEVLVLAVGGLLTGGLVGLALARVLVAVLTGVFDPPPAAVTVPWTYLAATAGICVVALGRRRGGGRTPAARERGGAAAGGREVRARSAGAAGAAAPLPDDLQHERDQRDDDDQGDHGQQVGVDAGDGRPEGVPGQHEPDRPHEAPDDLPEGEGPQRGVQRTGDGVEHGAHDRDEAGEDDRLGRPVPGEQLLGAPHAVGDLRPVGPAAAGRARPGGR